MMATATPAAACGGSDEEAEAQLRLAAAAVFGYSALRPGQAAAGAAVLRGCDALVVLPTGGGKSLCFQLPALLRPGIALVLSPLLSLIQDQVAGLLRSGIPAAAYCSASSAATRTSLLRELGRRPLRLKLLYATPESILSSIDKSGPFIRLLQQAHGDGCLSLLVVDEAHCISSWGHDFRDAYRKLGTLRAEFPGLPCMALTATAPSRVREDITRNLYLRNPSLVLHSFDRPNFFYSVIAKKASSSSAAASSADRSEKCSLPSAEPILAYIRQRPGECGIVYCLSRDESRTLCAYLNTNRVRAGLYTAEQSMIDRQQVQQDWTSGRIMIVVATIAFGMGIDKPDVRFVLHATLSKSIEGYYQESGRAGRDGKRAECIIFFNGKDVARIKFMIRSSLHGAARKRAYDLLESMDQYCRADTGCRREMLLSYFGEKLRKCSGCDLCTATKPLCDLLKKVKKRKP